MDDFLGGRKTNWNLKKKKTKNQKLKFSSLTTARKIKIFPQLFLSVAISFFILVYTNYRKPPIS